MDNLVAAVAAIGGVALGALLTARSQRQLQRSLDDQAARESRARAYIDLLVAYRRFRRYILSATASVVILAGPEGQQLPVVEGSEKYWRDVDEAAAAVDVLAGDRPPAEFGRRLGKEIGILARAKADAGTGYVPDEVVRRVREAEQAFATAARDDVR